MSFCHVCTVEVVLRRYVCTVEVVLRRYVCPTRVVRVSLQVFPVCFRHHLPTCWPIEVDRASSCSTAHTL